MNWPSDLHISAKISSRRYIIIITSIYWWVARAHGGEGLKLPSEFFFFFKYNSCTKIVKIKKLFIINNNPFPRRKRVCTLLK